MSRRAWPLWFLGLALLPAGRAVLADEPPRAPEVSVARPVVQEVTDHEDFTGRTDTSRSVNLLPRVTGYLTAVKFKEGGPVKEGELLFEIDPRPYQAKLDQALSQVDLGKAGLELARATLTRDQALAKAAQGSVSPQQLDQDRAAVNEAQARVKAAEAGVTLCKLELDLCKVRAPVSGRIGLRQVAPGNLVKQDETLLAVLTPEGPTYVYFDIDERTFLRLRQRTLKGKAEADKLPVAVALADDAGFSRRGVVDFIDNRVDPATGTVRLRATLADKDGLLTPGLFVRVRLTVGEPYKALLVSDRAVLSDQGRKYVYVVDADNKVQYRPVTTGPLQPHGLRVIAQGLKPDDRVVLRRLGGLRAGMTVRPRAVEMPAPDRPAPPAAGPSVRRQVGSGIRVEATYLGATAETVSDAVRFPVEQQVSGLEKVRYLR